METCLPQTEGYNTSLRGNDLKFMVGVLSFLKIIVDAENVTGVASILPLDQKLFFLMC